MDCPPEPLCTEDKVLELLRALDTSKANGPDNISAKYVKIYCRQYSPCTYFCSGKSTIQALLTATNDWLKMMESGIEAPGVYFDFTKAFESVPHKAFIEKLQAIGLDDYLVQDY